MPYLPDGTGFNRGSYTSWLAAQKQAGKRENQSLRILALFHSNVGVVKDGRVGLSSWHVKTYLQDMFANGQTTSWTARLPDMVKAGILVKGGRDDTFVDPDNSKRTLYFLAEDPLDI